MSWLFCFSKNAKFILAFWRETKKRLLCSLTFFNML
jgi:hypothetical protein